MNLVRRAVAATALLTLTGVAAAVVPGVAAAEETFPVVELDYDIAEQWYGYPDSGPGGHQDGYKKKPKYKDPQPEPTYPEPEPEYPEPEYPEPTPEPTTEPTPEPERPQETPEPELEPEDKVQLPVTGSRSIAVAGLGLLLVGLGAIGWMLGGRRGARI